MDVTELLTFGVSNRASDMHLSSGMPPLLRVDGEIRRINLPLLQDAEVKSLIYDIMNDHQRKIFEQQFDVDFAFELPNLARFRVNVFIQSRGIAAAFRIIPPSIVSLDKLRAPKIFKDIADLPNGLVLVTGPTGSGKSTTLAAIIDYINNTYCRHILTIEDPIEFIHTSNKSLVNQRELASHTKSFASAIKAGLREDPDCILVGEMRDVDTIHLALTAAETGHLVFATLHTVSAAKSIDRIVDVFPAEAKDAIRAMLSESLRAVISQLLIKKKDAIGRVAAHEIMIINSAIKNLIRENKISQINAAIQTGQQIGMQTLDQALLRLVKIGEISVATATSLCIQKELFLQIS
jgi:twitching motility protein PilT